jgi:hypothetical protein
VVKPIAKLRYICAHPDIGAPSPKMEDGNLEVMPELINLLSLCLPDLIRLALTCKDMFTSISHDTQYIRIHHITKWFPSLARIWWRYLSHVKIPLSGMRYLRKRRISLADAFPNAVWYDLHALHLSSLELKCIEKPLIYLNVSSNPIESVPITYNIETLDISETSCDIKNIGAPKVNSLVCTSIKNSEALNEKKVRKLHIKCQDTTDLSTCNLDTLEELYVESISLASLTELSLPWLPKLKRLFLGNVFGVNVLPDLPSLEELYISNSMLSVNGFGFLPKLVKLESALCFNLIMTPCLKEWITSNKEASYIISEHPDMKIKITKPTGKIPVLMYR